MFYFLTLKLSCLSSELRETVSSLLEEKKNFVCQIHDQQRQIEVLALQVRRVYYKHSPARYCVIDIYNIRSYIF